MTVRVQDARWTSPTKPRKNNHSRCQTRQQMTHAPAGESFTAEILSRRGVQRSGAAGPETAWGGNNISTALLLTCSNRERKPAGRGSAAASGGGPTAAATGKHTRAKSVKEIQGMCERSDSGGRESAGTFGWHDNRGLLATFHACR